MRRPILILASHAFLAVAFLLTHFNPWSIPATLLAPALVLLFPGMLLGPHPEKFSWRYWIIVSALSSGVWVVALVIVRIIGLHLHAWHAWVFLWACLILAQSTRYRHVISLTERLRNGIRRMNARTAVLLLAGFVFSYISASSIVPPQQDQDMVIANPTYGYLQHGKPYGTETHFSYIFSKPPLLHLQAGFTMLVLDRLEPAHFYWQSGRIVELLEEVFWSVRRFRQRDVECFDINTDLMRATRSLHLLYSTVAPLIIADLAMILGASSGVSLVAGLVYITLPEVVIRSGYAGFTTPSTVLLALSALLLAAPRIRGDHALFLLGVLLAITNQKMLYIPAVFVLFHLVRSRQRSGLREILTHPWLLGIAVGTAAWWSYGALVDWSTFIRDHIYYDFRDRFLFQDMSLGEDSPAWYPGIGGLWIEWVRNWTPPLIVLGASGVLWGLWQDERLRFLSLWALAGWILGSLTDWRQTKHLMLTVVPMITTATVLIDRLPSKWRRIVGLVIAGAILYNLSMIVRIWVNFDSLPPSTVW